MELKKITISIPVGDYVLLKNTTNMSSFIRRAISEKLEGKRNRKCNDIDYEKITKLITSEMRTIVRDDNITLGKFLQENINREQSTRLSERDEKLRKVLQNFANILNKKG